MNQIDRRLEEELVAAVPHLRRWASSFATREYDADQLTQDTVVSFLEHPEKYVPDRGSLRNFLFASLRSKALDFSRSYNRIYKKEFRLFLRRQAQLLLKPGPASDSPRVDLVKEVDRQLERMPWRLAEAFRLFAFEGKGPTEIAQVFKITPAHARSILYRARVKLRGYLESA